MSSCCSAFPALALPVESRLCYIISCQRVAKQMFIHVKMPQIITSTLLGNKYLQRQTAILPSDLGKWRRWRFHPQDVTALYHVCLSCRGVECECLCVRTLGPDVCLRVFSALLTFPQTWLTFPGDLKIWSLLCLKSCVLPSSKHWGKCCSRAGSVPCLQGLTLQHLEQPVLTHPECDQEKTRTIHCLPFRDDWFTAWSFT